MHVGVDEAGQQDVVAEVLDAGTGRYLRVVREYGPDLSPATATEAARVPSGVMTRVERSTSSTSDTRTPLCPC